MNRPDDSTTHPARSRVGTGTGPKKPRLTCGNSLTIHPAGGIVCLVRAGITSPRRREPPMSATTTATKATTRTTAPKGAVKAAPAKKAPAPKPVAKKTPVIIPAATPAPVPVVTTTATPAKDTGIKPSWGASKAMGKGRAHTFRLKTEEIALSLGYLITNEPPYDNVVIFERGDTRVRVTYNTEDFVHHVDGAIEIVNQSKDKWKRLNAELKKLAAANPA